MISENAKNRWIMDFSNGVSLSFAPLSVRDNKELVIIAVSLNGMNLNFASERLRNDVDVVEKAVSQNILALQFANVDLQKQIIFSGIKEVKKQEDYLNDSLNNEDVMDEMSFEIQGLYEGLDKELFENSDRRKESKTK